jgi:hypothetical protein
VSVANSSSVVIVLSSFLRQLDKPQLDLKLSSLAVILHSSNCLNSQSSNTHICTIFPTLARFLWSKPSSAEAPSSVPRDIMAQPASAPKLTPQFCFSTVALRG